MKVTMKQVTDTSVTFAARSSSATGNSDHNLLRLYTVARSEVFAEPFDGAPEPPVAMVAGATGALYLSRTGWQTTSDGFRIFGAAEAVFKFPRCAGTTMPLMTELPVVPSSIVVRGHLAGDTAMVEIELLGPDAAGAQDIEWNCAEPIEIQLTEDGARRLCVTSPSLCAAVWPVRIVVRGSPVFDRAVAGEVNLLDHEIAGAMQHIAFAERGSPITLVLTQDGANAFHVTPQIVAEFTQRAG